MIHGSTLHRVKLVLVGTDLERKKDVAAVRKTAALRQQVVELVAAALESDRDERLRHDGMVAEVERPRWKLHGKLRCFGPRRQKIELCPHMTHIAIRLLRPYTSRKDEEFQAVVAEPATTDDEDHKPDFDEVHAEARMQPVAVRTQHLRDIAAATGTGRSKSTRGHRAGAAEKRRKPPAKAGPAADPTPVARRLRSRRKLDLPPTPPLRGQKRPAEDPEGSADEAPDDGPPSPLPKRITRQAAREQPGLVARIFQGVVNFFSPKKKPRPG